MDATKTDARSVFHLFIIVLPFEDALQHPGGMLADEGRLSTGKAIQIRFLNI